MKASFRTWLSVWLGAAVFMLLLSGCGVSEFRSAEDLFVQPQLPEEYKNLNATIEQVKSSLDAEQTAPLTGSNTSAIQLLDLNSDGEEEAAVAFFRSNSSDDPQPLKIYIFRMGSDGTYQIAYRIQGEGNNVGSIAYRDLDGDGILEVVVSWQLANRVYVLSVYALGPAEATELVHSTYNESYVLADLNGDGLRELVVIQRDDTGESYSRASYYTYQDGMLVMTSEAALSANVNDVTSVRTGVLAGQTPAIYVTSDCEGGQVTDILAYQDGGLVNVTINQDSGISNYTLRSYTGVSVTDINNDGVLEVPVALALPSVRASSETTHWIIYWRQFDALGHATVACITYHSTEDGWYLILPSSWDGQIAVERDDRENHRGEQAVVFYHQEYDGSLTRFMTIYRLTGTNREARANLGSRQLLLSTSSVAYAVEFASDGWDCGLNIDQVRDRFNLITTEWSTVDNT